MGGKSNEKCMQHLAEHFKEKKRSVKRPGWEKVMQMDVTEIGYVGEK